MNQADDATLSRRAGDVNPPVDHDPTQRLRWSVYWLLIIAATAASSGRIFSVTGTGRDPATPFLSANDRSRWCTIRALVDHGTFVIDDVIFETPSSRSLLPEGTSPRASASAAAGPARQAGPTPSSTLQRVDGWHTIDLVRHRGWDGREHYYSSKPVLMPTLMAGVYALVKQATGASLATHPFYAGRLVLWLCNIPPLVLMWWLLARMIDRYGRDDWSRLLAMAAATFGTFLTTFSITLNNHLHAAVCVTVTAFCLSEIVRGERRGVSPTWFGHFSLAGLFAALTFANELPALAFLALVFAAVLWCDWRKTLLWFVPPAAVVLVAMVALNYAAHGSLRPPYMHRGDGPVVARAEVDVERVRQGDLQHLREVVVDKLKGDVSPSARIEPRMQINAGDDVSDRYVLWDEAKQVRLALRLAPEEGVVEIREWDNWYEYQGTYWSAERKRGVDRGEPSKLVYALHCLVGHHGLFSLTPLWVIAVAGMGLVLLKNDDPLRGFAAGTLVLSLICLVFYLFLRPLEDRNYGGVCNGLRWMMWFIPLWLVAMLPALSYLGRTRWGRVFALVCLAISVFSASYKPMNPWSHPWLFDYWEYLRLISYP